MESAPHLDVLAQALHGFGHPIRVRALVLLEFETSPRDIALALGEPLGVVSYHVRMLRDYGLATETRTEPKRGALAHFYRRTELADELLRHLNGMVGAPARTRGRQGRQRWDALVAWATDGTRAAA